MTHFLYLTPEILLPFSPLTSTEFELIRRKAQQLWQDETRWSASSMTTYSGSYREKQLDEATCNRLAQRVGQPQFEYKPTPLPGSSAYNTLLGHAGSQKAADGKGRLPDIASSSRDSPLNIKHKVAHQIWGSEVPCPTFLGYRGLRMSPCMQPKKPGFELLMSYRNRGKALLKRLQRQWDYESKLGSSEDSGTDRFSSNTSGSSGRKFK
uniref:RIKEN cDNA 1700011L22 gene n=1 Tax=Mus spicilegus TaxID=10103 RepID=A0A8C6IC72_MUSSI